MTHAEVVTVALLFGAIGLVGFFKWLQERAAQKAYAKLVQSNQRANIRQIQELIGQVKNQAIQKTVEFKNEETNFRKLDEAYRNPAIAVPVKPDSGSTDGSAS